MSPVDLAKVATAKMTNELILKSQGFGQGLLQMSNNRPMHSHNIAFLPQKNAQMYVSPKLFNPVNQHKTSRRFVSYPSCQYLVLHLNYFVYHENLILVTTLDFDCTYLSVCQQTGCHLSIYM
jgi:hypothetical protein